MISAYFFVILSYVIVGIALAGFGIQSIVTRKRFVEKLRDEGFISSSF